MRESPQSSDSIQKFLFYPFPHRRGLEEHIVELPLSFDLIKPTKFSIRREQREVGFQPNPILLFNFSTGVDLEVFNVHHATLLQFGCGL